MVFMYMMIWTKLLCSVKKFRLLLDYASGPIFHGSVSNVFDNVRFDVSDVYDLLCRDDD